MNRKSLEWWSRQLSLTRSDRTSLWLPQARRNRRKSIRDLLSLRDSNRNNVSAQAARLRTTRPQRTHIIPARTAAWHLSKILLKTNEWASILEAQPQIAATSLNRPALRQTKLRNKKCKDRSGWTYSQGHSGAQKCKILWWRARLIATTRLRTTNQKRSLNVEVDLWSLT